MRYQHHDGSVCRRRGETWIIEKVHTPKLGVMYTEEVGDPCPYCNKYPEDATELQKAYQRFLNRISMAYGWFVAGCGTAGLVIALLSLLTAKNPNGYLAAATAIDCAIAVLFIWLGVAAVFYHKSRRGQSIED